MGAKVLAADSKQRFSNRVDDYVRHRPGYPRVILDVLRVECRLRPESIVADIGSGTGILTKLLLENGNLVYGVEPNAAMREAGEEFLRKYSRFRSVAGSAETSTLPGATIDLVVAGQAFHWFDRRAARAEFVRVLKARGRVALIWNERDVNSSPFMREYEELLQRHGTDYSKIQHVYSEQAGLNEFFAPREVHAREFENKQVVDWDGMKGRLLSASYAPKQSEAGHEAMIEDFKGLFAAHRARDRVTIQYRTRIYWGMLEPQSNRNTARNEDGK
jgi:SAM-dependent methyltransferase